MRWAGRILKILAATIVAIAIYAIGEGLQAPRYYEYVADLAPKEQVGTYMGFAFLPIAIGTFIAGWSSGYLVKHYVEGGNPNAPQMWYVVGAYGIVSTILMVLYDRFVAPKRAAARSRSSVTTGSFSQARIIPARTRSRSKRTRSPLFLTTRSGVSSTRS